MADNIRATPRNPVLGLFSDITQGGLDYLRDPRFRQAMMQLPAPVRPFGMGAVALPGLFESTGFPKTLERAAYGEPLTNIGMANVPTLKPETADAMMTFAPMIGPAIRATKGLPVGMSIKDVSYRGSHTAPGPDFGAPLHDLTGGGQMYPADVYSSKAAQYYGTGYAKADKEAFELAKKVRGNPDAEVTMYRAVPKDESIANINAGDWVTLSKDYAKNHGESVLGNNYKIISKKVKAKELWTNADSIHEFGYNPEKLANELDYPSNPMYTDPLGYSIR